MKTTKERNQLTDEDKKITEKVGLLIAKARKNSGITQVELAKRLKINQSMICIYEQGRRRIPINQFIKIAKAIGISPGKLLDGDDDFKKNNGKPSRRFLKRLKEIEKLPDFEQRALAKTIDAFITSQAVKSNKTENSASQS